MSMETKVENYKKASFLMAGLGCFINVLCHWARSLTVYENPFYKWVTAIITLTIPIFCFWVGGLIRAVSPKPKTWVKIALICFIPIMYLCLVLWSDSGYGYLMLFLAIMGFLLLPVAEGVKGKGWLALCLFLASAFCYSGIVRVSDHFAMPNFTFIESEWTLLFTRAIKVVPLTMSLFFLMVFCLSEIGQNLGSKKWVQVTTSIIVVITGVYLWLIHSSFYFSTFWFRRAKILLVHPFTVYLIIVIVRAIKNIHLKQSWKGLFKI